MVNDHGGAHELVVIHLAHRARRGGQYLRPQRGRDVQPLVGAPVQHGLVIEQRLHAVRRDDRSLYRPREHQCRGLHRLGRLRAAVRHLRGRDRGRQGGHGAGACRRPGRGLDRRAGPGGGLIVRHLCSPRRCGGRFLSRPRDGAHEKIAGHADGRHAQQHHKVEALAADKLGRFVKEVRFPIHCKHLRP